MAGILFSPEFPQGSPAHVGGLQSLVTVTSFVYWYGRKYSIYKYSIYHCSLELLEVIHFMAGLPLIPHPFHEIRDPPVDHSTIYNSQDMDATSMSIDGWMDKEDVVQIYNGILLSHKKEWNNTICSDMDGPRDYHTKWSKSDRERQITYDITYMRNLKNWHKWTYLQNRN